MRSRFDLSVVSIYSLVHCRFVLFILFTALTKFISENDGFACYAAFGNDIVDAALSVCDCTDRTCRKRTRLELVLSRLMK